MTRGWRIALSVVSGLGAGAGWAVGGLVLVALGLQDHVHRDWLVAALAAAVAAYVVSARIPRTFKGRHTEIHIHTRRDADLREVARDLQRIGYDLDRSEGLK